MAITLNGTTGITTPDISSTTSTLGALTQALDLGSTGQIVFPATQNASTNANTLDDYEEGTWTPSLGGNTTYFTQTGTYTKIGRMVYVQCELYINAIGTGSTTQISGLPFNGGVDSNSGLAIQYVEVSSTNVVYLVARVRTSTIYLASLTAAGATVGANAIFKNGTAVTLGGCYQI